MFRVFVFMFLFMMLFGCSTQQEIIIPLNTIDNASSLLITISDSADRKYLGIPSNRVQFPLESCKADVLIMEILNMACLKSHREAEKVNQIIPILKEAGHAKNIKVIGIAAGNTDTEAALFKERFAVPFPIIPDPDRRISQSFGQDTTPSFVILKRISPQAFALIFTHTGGYTDSVEFLQQVIDRVNAFEDAQGKTVQA